MSCGVPGWTQAPGLFNVGKTTNLNQKIAVSSQNSTNFLLVFCTCE